MLGASFQQFSIEALLASASLRSGLTALNKCKYHDKGSFYNAFFQLSIGLERFFKIIYVVQYMIENDLNKPTYSHLRKLGHDISILHQNAVNVAIKYEKKDKGKWVLNDEQSAILTMLSEFGKETRYYNLNTIIEDKKLINDPLEQWNCILEYCYWKYTSAAKRERLSQEVISWAERNRLYGFTNEFGLDGHIMTHVDQYLLNWKVNKISPCIAWEIISMLQPYYFLLMRLRDTVQLKEQDKGIKDPLVPYFHEIFPYFLLDRATAKRRRNWLD
ncbi:hypothetical protein QT346_30715 (plasmid) [Escherichia coli]|uniref:hypothetical protein n=1 Tax=Escherichia coli TaxID=562 RepID=UPI00259D10F3|nr:hypothetical protein [Escherichia coli]MBZ9504469.1 hypothetical protein [Escherichia coli]MDM4911219.1 hypothetical protein [Escherichia coli]MDM4916239.1 hypothetical protein [Escherichia coli]MDM4921533.1 hypothetical protein [Escherichia coli]MDM4927048.1 hypothetical protein [Escherichia coli]